MGSLNNQTIWITGASGGIGKALSKSLSKQGATIILSGRNKEKLNKVKDLCKEPPDNQADHLIVPFDICNPESTNQAYETVKNHTGRIDWLVNNAGISQRSLIMETSEEVERKIMEINYFAQTRLTRLVLPDMVDHGSGKIVMMSSVAGLLGTQYRSTYSAAKAALHMWANSLRAELYDEGIEVTTIFPGFVQTNISINALTANGSSQKTIDKATDEGLTTSQFARQVTKSLINGEEYIVVGGRKEKNAVLLNRISPPRLYKKIRDSQVK